MLSLAAWVVYCGLIAAVLAAGAFAWEYSARWSGRPARWGWAAALAGSAGLPWVLRLLPERAWPDVIPAALPALPAGPVSLEPIGAGLAPAAAAGWSLVTAGIVAWALLSVAMLAWLVWAVLGVAAARRRWPTAELDGGRVFLSRHTGPAALGLRRGVVVLPAWALELGDDVRSLLLVHEREHVRAGDPRLLFLGLLCVASMPWNPLLWLQLLRLRNAIELDCDTRVLRRGVDPRAYGTLLLEVGRRRSATPLVMATFAEPRVFLEERIRRIAAWPLRRNRGRAAAAAACALLFCVMALSARDPLRAGAAGDAVTLLPLAGAGSDAAPLPSPGMHVNERGDVWFELDPIPVEGVAAAPVRAPAAMAVDTPPPAPPAPALTEGPTFTPMTVRPQLVNREDVARALEQGYPPALRAAGIGGTALLWFFIDEEGRVQRLQLSRSSGYPALDEAALQVASGMRFSPAFNRDRRVSVWVEIPIVFHASAPAGQQVRRQDGQTEPVPAPARPAGAAEGREPQPRAAAMDAAALRAAGPVFTPMTARPELRNAAEVQRALVRSYPPLLRDAGIGGAPVLWFLIDEEGAVADLRLSRSSGYPALDEAALAVGREMRFGPALNRDRRVAVWVEIPIVFTAR